MKFSSHIAQNCRRLKSRQCKNVYNIARSSTSYSLRSKQSTLSRSLPRGTWDSHMHVVDPQNFPLDVDAQYTPHPHTLVDAKAFYSALGIKNMVFVQPSIYGNDNSCMLEALKEVGPSRGRAIVGIDPKTTSIETLQEWHGLGVRGARLNFVSVGRELSEIELHREIESYVALLEPLDWVLELFIPMKQLVALEKILPSLDDPFVCIDHFGWPNLPAYDPSRPLDPYSLDGFESLTRLLQRNAWVKLSAPYRLSKDPEIRDLGVIARELIKDHRERVIYATDWPHTRFDNIDPVPFIEKCFEWCADDERRVEKLFRENALELWGAHVVDEDPRPPEKNR
ncbi:hypothetical protein LTR84_006723 [Exophiala bonariae]|uniref:Amidohydrolase-related domain-containing protein n=1 Tax=Exophiala bonariae TaxID=1690606 RepID=A0AAV9MZS4_9EURO|nr:hypothetical protein LTR84_006723 [Exophiala bonariae]